MCCIWLRGVRFEAGELEKIIDCSRGTFRTNPNLVTRIVRTHFEKLIRNDTYTAESVHVRFIIYIYHRPSTRNLMNLWSKRDNFFLMVC